MGNIDELARLMGYDGKSDEVSLGYGLVTAISESSVTCDYKGATIDAVRCCNPNVGDIVAIEAQGGQTRAIAVKGGETHGGGEQEQTHIYYDKPNLIEGTKWLQGNGSTGNTSTTRVHSEKLVYFKKDVKYMYYTNHPYYHTAYFIETDANGTWKSWKYGSANTSGNAITHVTNYVPTADHWGRVAMIYGSDETITPVTIASDGVRAVLIEETPAAQAAGYRWDAQWLVKRTGDFVELYGNLPATQVAITSTTNLSNDYLLPVMMDDGMFNLQMTPDTYYVTRTNYQSDHLKRNVINAYLQVIAHTGMRGFVTSTYVAGKSTSDYPIRTYTQREISPWVLRADGKDVYIKNSHDDNPPYSWSWWNPITSAIAPTLPAGTYQMGLNCNSDVLDNRTFKFPIGSTDKDVLMFCCAVVDGTSYTNLRNWIAYSKINDSQTKDDIDTLYPYLTNTFTLTEPTKVQLWFTMIGGGEAYDVVLTPWIRRIK